MRLYRHQGTKFSTILLLPLEIDLLLLSLQVDLLLQPLKVDRVVVELGVCQGVQQQVERDQASHEHRGEEHSLSRLRVGNLHKVWKAHEVAVGVHEEGCGEVAGSYEEEGRVHPEDRRVGELEE